MTDAMRDDTIGACFPGSEFSAPIEIPVPPPGMKKGAGPRWKHRPQLPWKRSPGRVPWKLPKLFIVSGG